MSNDPDFHFRYEVKTKYLPAAWVEHLEGLFERLLVSISEG